MKTAQASNTAKVIAASTLLLASDQRSASLIAPGAAALCQQFLSTNRTDRWLAKSAAHPLTRALWRGVERIIQPGIMMHFWNRKRWIERHCRAAIANGFERIVVIGAGFDTLGYRLADEFPQLDIIEIDHPATQGVKRLALAGDKVAPPPNLRFVARDLSIEQLPLDMLNDGKPTIFIMEGVLMYLSSDDIGRLFATLRELSAERMQILFSFMTKWPDGGSGFRPRSRIIEYWLAWRSEPFTWAIEPEAMESFLGMHQLKLMELTLTREFTTPSEARGAKLEGENMVWCEPDRRVLSI